MNGLRPIPETRGRLAGLLGGDDKVNAIVAKYRDELQNARTLPVGRIPKSSGTAEYFVALSGQAVDGVKFVSGEDNMRAMAEALRGLHYSLLFPDNTPTKILRRGVLSCPGTAGECRFVLMLPDDVRSVD
jgi:hypothetical protein